MLIPSIRSTLNELLEVIQQFPNDIYTKPSNALSSATIGEHTRHIIELFQCLENQYESGSVNYDKRARNYQIQTDGETAKIAIQIIMNSLEKTNKDLNLEQCIDGEVLIITSNYQRELLYNLEHCIHHQALIKVALLEFEIVTFDKNFGVARSTIEYRNQCAQ
jgi:poly-beta-hydroxyalkanoate depolymerase